MASCLRNHSSGVFAEFELARDLKWPHSACICAAVGLPALPAGPLLRLGSALSSGTSPGFTCSSRLIKSALSACLHLLINTAQRTY